jgi:hypothetical protein
LDFTVAIILFDGDSMFASMGTGGLVNLQLVDGALAGLPVDKGALPMAQVTVQKGTKPSSPGVQISSTRSRASERRQSRETLQMPAQPSGGACILDAMIRDAESTLSDRRLRGSLEQRLLKLEATAGAYEFVPVMMHLVNRYLANLCDEHCNEMDRRLTAALSTIPEARRWLEVAAVKQLEVPRALKRRLFSPEYIGLRIHRTIDAAEVASIVRRASALRRAGVGAPSSPEATAVSLPVSTARDTGCSSYQASPSLRPDPGAVQRNRYEVSYTGLQCAGRSDYECGRGDGSYVVFGVTTQKMAEDGAGAAAIHTPVYSHVVGDPRFGSSDAALRLYGFAEPELIDSPLLITASCFEQQGGVQPPPPTQSGRL